MLPVPGIVEWNNALQVVGEAGKLYSPLLKSELSLKGTELLGVEAKSQCTPPQMKLIGGGKLF
jgi:hypothetical protein